MGNIPDLVRSLASLPAAVPLADLPALLAVDEAWLASALADLLNGDWATIWRGDAANSPAPRLVLSVRSTDALGLILSERGDRWVSREDPPPSRSGTLAAIPEPDWMVDWFDPMADLFAQRDWDKSPRPWVLLGLTAQWPIAPVGGKCGCCRGRRLARGVYCLACDGVPLGQKVKPAKGPDWEAAPTSPPSEGTIQLPNGQSLPPRRQAKPADPLAPNREAARRRLLASLNSPAPTTTTKRGGRRPAWTRRQ